MATTYEQRQANIDRIKQPIDDWSDKSLQLTLSDIAKKEAKADEEDRFNRNAAAKKKADDETEARLDKRMRRQRILDLARQGIEVPDDATDKDIARVERTHKNKRAKLVIGMHESDLAANEAEYGEKYRELQELASNASTIEEKRAAIDEMLLNPEVVKILSDDQKKQLLDAKSSKDPTAVVAKIAGYIGGDYWLFPGKNPSKAQSVIDAYSAPLREAAALSRQIKYKEINDKLNDISANRKVIQTELSRSYKDNAEWLDEADLKRSQAATGVNPVATTGSEMFGPPAPAGLNPNDDMADLAKKTTPKESSEDIINRRGYVGLAADKAAAAERLLGRSPAGVFFPGTEANKVAAEGASGLPEVAKVALFGNPNTSPVTLEQLNRHRAAVGKQQVPTLNVAEARKFLASLPPEKSAQILNKAAEVGMTQEQVAAGRKAVEFGDLNDPETQKAILGSLMLYQMTTGNWGLPPITADEQFVPLSQ